MQIGSESGLVDGGDGKAMSLVEKIWRVGVAKIELIIEIDAARHDVLGKRVSGLERQTVPESPLALHEECVVVIDTRADQGIELSGIAGTIAPLGQKLRIQIWQHDRTAGTSASVRGSRSALN